MRLSEKEDRKAANGVIGRLASHSPLVDRLDFIGGVRATVHVAVLSAGRALEDGGADAYREGDSLVRDCALRRLREDLPYLVLALGSASPEGAEARSDAIRGLRIIRDNPGNGQESILASRLLAAVADASLPAAPLPDQGNIQKAVLAVEGCEKAMELDMDQFEASRRKLDRHRAYEGLEGLLPDMLLSLDAGIPAESSLRGLCLLCERVTPLVRPGAVLAGMVLERLAHAGTRASRDLGQGHGEGASVDLAQ